MLSSTTFAYIRMQASSSRVHTPPSPPSRKRQMAAVQRAAPPHGASLSPPLHCTRQMGRGLSTLGRVEGPLGVGLLP